MPSIYNRYAVYVICSHYEGNPKTLLEAMACGRAVIGTEVPGIREIIKHDENGLLVPENAGALRQAIQRFFNDPDLRSRLGQAARRKILIENSLEVAIKNEYEAYKKIRNKTNPTPTN